MTTPAQSNAHLDEGSRFWASNPDHATPDTSQRNDIDDDVASAVREARERRTTEREIESSRDDLETLRRGFGSIKGAIEFNQALHRAYTADPDAAREWHQREYAKRLPDVGPVKKAQATPPSYLDERGRAAWQLEQDVRDAIEQAPAERAFRKDLEEAAPLLAQARRTHGPLNKSLEICAGLHTAMGLNPAIADRISETFGAPATTLARQERASQEMFAAAEYAGLNDWVGRVVESQSLPGLDRPDVQERVAEEIVRQNASGQSKGKSVEQRLVDAYAVTFNAMQNAHRVEQEKAAGASARRASRSLSAAPSGGDDNRPFKMEPEDNGEDQTAFDAARRAYRDITGRSNRV